MARSLQNPTYRVEISATLRNQLTTNVNRIATGQVTFSKENKMNVSNNSGVGLNECNRAWEYEGIINSGANLVLDVYDMAGFNLGAGGGLDMLGQALALEEIVAIAISNENADGASGILEIQPDDSNGWSPIGTHTASNGGGLRAQGILFKAQPAEAGFDVTDASSHRIKLTANGASCAYKIAILARHDDDESSSSSSQSSSSSSSSSSSTSSQS